MPNRDSIQDIWGARTPYHDEKQWPIRVDEHVTEEPERWVQSCCVLCTNGCGLEIGVKEGRIVGVRKHTVGFEKLREVAAKYPPERVADITGIPAAQLREYELRQAEQPIRHPVALQREVHGGQGTALRRLPFSDRL